MGFHFGKAGFRWLTAFGGKPGLDGLEAAGKFSVSSPQRRLAIQPELAAEIGHDEEQIAHFIR
jgi:hypothetical protein